MGPHIPSYALLLALIGQAHAQPALDDATSCSVAVSAFSSADQERMQAVANFIENAFEQLDRRYTENGEAGIANERLRSALVGAAVGFCRQHQNSTIFIEATNAYRGYARAPSASGHARIKLRVDVEARHDPLKPKLASVL